MKSASEGIGKRLRQARLKRGLTMDQLAEKTNISQSAISVIELGSSLPNTLTVERLARGLSIDPCWLAYGTGPKPEWLIKDNEAESDKER